MMEFGKSLRDAREAKGLTVAQMTEMTHLAPTTISELEAEDFSRIAAPIYGRGFVKLYCEAVGLDPKPFIAEFMELMSGTRDTSIKERPVASTPEPTATAAMTETPTPLSDEPQSADEVPPADEALSTAPSAFVPQQDLFGEEIPQKLPPTPRPRHMPITPPPPAEPDEPIRPVQGHENAPDDHSFSRYAEPMRQLKPLIHTPLWRIGVLAGLALLLLVLLGLGIRAIYRATNVKPATAEAAPIAEAIAAKAPKAATKPPESGEAAASAAAKPLPSTTRTPQKIPALYID